jgi:hypothetical protein
MPFIRVPRFGTLYGNRRDLDAASAPLPGRPGAPAAIVQACRIPSSRRPGRSASSMWTRRVWGRFSRGGTVAARCP